MNKIILILPYFGKLPNTFNFFFQSCRNNPCIDWLFFTDCQIPEFDNIKVIHFTWNDFVSYIQTKFNFPIALTSPYKLCDFRPAYGYIFDEYISKYLYWGHCDCDIIWGDLHSLYNLMDKGYERIGIWGHLSLYKNNKTVNQLFVTLHSQDVPSYQTVFSNRKNYSFDEFAGMNRLLVDNNRYINDNRFFDDIIFYTTNFFTRRNFRNYNMKHSTPCYFIYKKGKLFRRIYINHQWEEDESLYVHLQKRKMKIETLNTDYFTIIPNRYIDTGIYTDQQLYRLTKAPFIDIRYYKMLLKSTIAYYIKYILKWGRYITKKM